MPRIVSLLPSATEIVCALGFEQDLVGRSHECDFPPSVTRLPPLTEPKFRPEGTSAQIDRDVKRIVAEALAVYRVDADKLRALRPDVIVTQSQCEVCAVNESDVQDAVTDWIGAPPKIVSLKPYALRDLFNDMQYVADALDAHQRGVDLIQRLRTRMADIAAKAQRTKPRPSLATIEWLDPMMAAANWMPELIEQAGGVNLFGKSGEHSPKMTFDDFVAKDPDAILISPCGFPIARTLEETDTLTQLEGWAALRAVRDGRVFVADGNQYFNRPGPRIVESLEILAEIIHPEVFNFGHEGSGWRRL